MPCFLVGESVASAIGAIVGVKCDAFSHQDGHIAAAIYSSGRTDLFCGTEFISFHVSGGTTDIMLSKYNGYNFDIKLIGASKDINVGQAVDRVGVAMGLNFPCGCEMESLATSYKGEIPRKKICVDGCSFNISGLENLSLKLFEETRDKTLISAFALDFISATLDKVSENVRMEYPDLPIVYAGGVMSNSIIKNVLSHRKDVYFASPEFSSDNASGIAYLTYIKNKK
jgi:N6-L-threonylcarbamoyladenine synthase